MQVEDSHHVVPVNLFQGHTIMYLHVVYGKFHLVPPTVHHTEDIECEVVEPI